MTTLREAAKMALEALDLHAKQYPHMVKGYTADAASALRAALAEPVAFDHGIGADRFKVVRGAFWWHVLIGDSPTEHGKFRSRAGAEKMAADLLREFRNGAFVQHEAALAEPVQEPVALETVYETIIHWDEGGGKRSRRELARRIVDLYTAPPQRKPLTDEEIEDIWADCPVDWDDTINVLTLARAIEQAHGIKGEA